MLRESGKGAEGHEIFRSEESSISLTFSSGQTKSREQADERGFGIRALRGGKLGFSYCEKEDDIGATVQRAASLSSFSPKTGFSFAPSAKCPSVKTLDSKTSGLAATEMGAILAQMRDAVERRGPKPRISMSAGTETAGIENSEGFSGSYRSSAFSVFMEAMDGDGYGFAYHEGISMPGNPEALGERAGEMAKAMKGAKKVEPGKYTVIFELTTMEDLLSVLLPSLSGEWKRKRTSLLSDKLGKEAFNSSLSIYDNPLAPGADTKPFDDEGTPSARVPLIEGGVLKNFIYDRETAALEGVSASGFCSRMGYSAAPSASRSNLEIAPGDYGNLEEELGDCITVHALHGSHTANTTTGDFGLEVNVAFRSRKGAEKEPVRGFLLSGNVFKLLNGTLFLEKRAETVGSIISPRIAFKDVLVIS